MHIPIDNSNNMFILSFQSRLFVTSLLDIVFPVSIGHFLWSLYWTFLVTVILDIVNSLLDIICPVSIEHCLSSLYWILLVQYLLDIFCQVLIGHFPLLRSGLSMGKPYSRNSSGKSINKHNNKYMHMCRCTLLKKAHAQYNLELSWLLGRCGSIKYKYVQKIYI